MKAKLLFSLIVIVLIGSMNRLNAQETPFHEFEIKLKSRRFIPPENLDLESVMSNTEGERAHVLMQFQRIPDSSIKLLLSQAGIKLLNYLPQNTWFASVPIDISPDSPALTSVRWIGRILPEDKIAPGIIDKDIGDWARTEQGEVILEIKHFADVDAQAFKESLLKSGAKIWAETPEVHSLTISIDDENIMTLANQDSIRWIETIPPPAHGESDRIRDVVGANIAQDLGLSGAGIRVGVFEHQHVYGGHPDFGDRVSIGDTDPEEYLDEDGVAHTTFVAGVIGGDGSLSSSQWRGMAPDVDIFSYRFPFIQDTTTIPDYVNDLQTAVNINHIDIANNSWGSGCSEFQGFGVYGGLSPILDAAVRGEGGIDNPVTIVFSAGNERNGDCVDNTELPYENYSTLNHPKAAKNIIAVGAIDGFNSKMSAYSSWGPTADGRIKPELVALGHYGGNSGGHPEISEVTNPFGAYTDPYGQIQYGGTNQQLFRAPNYPTTDWEYGWFGFTSCAAATTSGSIALLLERLRVEFPELENPLPSTVKALLIHTAEDLDDSTTWFNPGPDYASGYGLLKINRAIEYVDQRYILEFLEDQVYNNGARSYKFWVNATYPQVTSAKVTLAWDDPPAIENADPALVNDLDLVVIDPNGNRHYPWTLDPNNPSAPASRNQEDHTNNIEQVYVDDLSGIPNGYWEVRVEGSVPEGPQRFSIVFTGVPFPSNTVDLADNGDGTITDPSTNQMWLKDANLRYTLGEGSWMGAGWLEYAKDWAENLVFAGYDDWRLPYELLPGVGELTYLYHNALGNPYNWPMMNPGPFENLLISTDFTYYDQDLNRVTIPRLHDEYWVTTDWYCCDTEPALNLIDGVLADHFMVEVLRSAWAMRDIQVTDTTTGQGSTVTPVTGVSVTFENVSVGGATTVQVSAENPGAEQANFQFLGTFYDINTTATYTDGEGAVEVCLAYEHSDIPGCPEAGCPEIEQDLIIEHWDGVEWVPLPSTVNVDENIVCATAPSLSGFAIGFINFPPTANANGPYEANEGETLTVDASGSFDPDNSITLFEWDLDNDGEFDDASGVSTDIVFDDNGFYTIKLRVTDEFGKTDTDTAQITILDLAPSAEFIWSPESQDEGSPSQFTDQSTSSPDQIVDWSWDFAGQGNSSVQDPSFTFLDNGWNEVCLTVTDDDGSANKICHVVPVKNLAPTVDLITITPDPPIVSVGTTVNILASFSDPGTADIHIADWEWGDGSPVDPGAVTQGAGSGTVTGNHTYSEAGIYAIKLTVTDDDGGVGTAIFQYVVVFDPSAGFVTGGGWIYSAAGAYLPDPTLEGKANFGFVSKYKKGATVPEGQTEFQFQVADLNFHSSSYEWLVVTGDNFAKFKGVGTINGEGEYKFQIWAGDGTGVNGEDTFRIKIWYEENGVEVVVYENDMQQPIGGGSIVVHTK